MAESFGCGCGVRVDVLGEGAEMARLQRIYGGLEAVLKIIYGKG